MADWMDYDLSRIDARKFPLYCDACGLLLNHDQGEEGNCPRCERRFTRGELLWNLHGPEAFESAPPVNLHVLPESDRQNLFKAVLLVSLIVLPPLFIGAWLEEITGRYWFSYVLLAWPGVLLSYPSWRRHRRTMLALKDPPTKHHDDNPMDPAAPPSLRSKTTPVRTTYP